MKGFAEDTIFILVEIIMIAIFVVLLARAVGSVFNPDKEVVTLNTELLRAKINEACHLKQPVTLEKFNVPQPKPSRVLGVTDFLPTYSISGSGAADPHYVLYYEAFPPGEAIGWESYLDFNTRFIAPFDYAKYTGTDKLTKENPTIISESEINDFFKAMEAYRQEVLKKADAVAIAEIAGVEPTNVNVYVAVKKPEDSEPPWTRIKSGTGDVNEEIKDKILTVETPVLASVVFRRDEAEPSTSAAMEASLKLKKFGRDTLEPQPGKVFISVRNALHRADLEFYTDKIALGNVETKAEHKIDTTDDFHTYRIELNSGEVKVFVDGKDAITGQAKSGTENAYLWGAGNPDDPTKSKRGFTESYWTYVKYAGDKVRVVKPADVSIREELAKNPVLINNIVLSDNLNVMPTDPAKPPGHDITKTVNQLGNAGQWNGDRFEFTDYFGISKEERAYIKYRPCGDNALCLKTRDAVQRFPLDNACGNVQYIQMVYDATGLKFEDLVPAAYIAGELVGVKALSKVQELFGTKAGDAAFSRKFLETTLKLEGKDPSLLPKQNIFKSFFKAFGKKSLLKTAGKFAGPLKLVLIAEIIVHQSPDLAKNVMEATLRYKNSEFYIASPCQLKDGKMTITYEEKCTNVDELCSEGITYPIYEYKVEFDGTRSITNRGSHFMCLESIGKDKDEPEEYKDKYKTEIEKDKTKENVACIKIKMDDVKRKDFCWTNNPVFPKKGLTERLLSLVPGKTEALDAIVGCGIGAATTIWTGPGFLVGCAVGAGTSISLDEASNIWGAIQNEKSLKEQLFVRLGGLPVTEGTSYFTYTDDEKKADKNKKYIEAVEMAPTAVIGGGALKRFGEIAKNTFEIHWAWPR